MKKKTPEFLLDVKNPFEGEKLLKEYANGKIIIGVDEVGRGPLAGPVVACAVVLKESCVCDSLNDSKKIPRKKREAIFELVELQKEYKAIFDTLNNMVDKTFYLSPDAQDYLYEYNCRCIDYFNESKDDIIVRLEKKESFWKITKLAIVYGILENPSDLEKELISWCEDILV